MKNRSLVGLVSLVGFLTLACIALSPVILSGTSSKMKLDWSRLASVGQTYEGVGSLLTIFALAGVVISLLIQFREHKVSKLQILRSYHLELMKISLTDPAYRRIWTGLTDVSDERLKETGFINMVLWLWESRWELGDLDEPALRAALSTELFPSEASRVFWERSKDLRALAKVSSKRRSKFLQIVESEYQKSVASGAPKVPSSDTSNALKRRRRISLASASVGVVISLLIAKRHAPRSAAPDV